MKETIYTIPIHDAFSTDCACPICLFEKEQEAHVIEYTLGASMMEPDERQRSNEIGFCRHHYQMLLQNPNKLSLALILESHMEEIRQQLQRETVHLKPANGFFKKTGNRKQAVTEAGNKMKSISDGCLICQKLSNTLEKFIDNLFYLYRTEAEFPKRFWSVKGFCLPHTALLLQGAARNLNGDMLYTFSQKLLEQESAYLTNTKEDVSWFTKKFDYRYANADWKNAKDAVPRAVTLLSGE